MTGVAVLDSTFLIALEAGEEGAEAALARLVERGEPLRIPAAVWVEFLSSFAPSIREVAKQHLERTARFVAFDRELADAAARLQHELRREGRALGWHDLQVAATALHFDEEVVTAARAFERVPGLRVTMHA